MAGPNRPVIWSPEARADLFHIWSYYREAAGEAVADKLVRAIHAKCRILEIQNAAGYNAASIAASSFTPIASSFAARA